MRRSISIFGATGSVGRQTVALLRHQGGAERYDVRALTGHSNVAELAEAAITLRAELAVVADPARYGELKEALAGNGIAAAAGPAALIEAAERGADWTMAAIVGVAGLAPTLAAARAGGILALANKESLVSAGALLAATVRAAGGRILPVDSEHSAIFQALSGHGAPRRIVLTASGGPFRTWSRAEMAAVTPERAVCHPNWRMGAKISVDSASMFNKALEMIEAREFFGVAPGQVEVLVHPQSIVHSLVEFADGAMLAHLGPTDMCGPIGYALNWPERRALPMAPLDLVRIGMLSFEAPDEARFPALRLARAAMEAGGLMGAVMNGAKEAAQEAFLDGRAGFLDMGALVEAAMARLGHWAAVTSLEAGLEAVLAADEEARAAVRERLAVGVN
ncbi:MAG TPA: 1-deoxy-D-xylulose-5-phosphate reductoisomerase [Paracoccaceae bacterium]|nr:1-deoxy-D-xylulose-5-phosphate reductoisomerase [Paracoccaceae bacterium]